MKSSMKCFQKNIPIHVRSFLFCSYTENMWTKLEIYQKIASYATETFVLFQALVYQPGPGG